MTQHPTSRPMMVSTAASHPLTVPGQCGVQGSAVLLLIVGTEVEVGSKLGRLFMLVKI